MTTRREIVTKCGAGLAAIIAAGRAPAALVRSMVAGRFAMMRGSGGSSYESELEYIQTSGTQYIDTGIVPRSGYGMNISFSVVDVVDFVGDNESNGIIGTAIDGFGAETFSVCAYKYTWPGGGIYNIWAMLGNGESSYVDRTISLNRRYTIGLNYLNDSLMTLDGEVRASVSATEKSECNVFAVPIYIGALKMQPSGNVTAGASIKIFSAQISDGSRVVADYIPVLDMQGNPTLFDRMSRSYPVRSGNFIAGPDL